MFYGYFFSSVFNWWHPPAPAVDAGVIETPAEGTEEDVSSINEAMAAAINDPPAPEPETDTECTEPEPEPEEPIERSTPRPIPLAGKKKPHKKNKHRIH